MYNHNHSRFRYIAILLSLVLVFCTSLHYPVLAYSDDNIYPRGAAPTAYLTGVSLISTGDTSPDNPNEWEYELYIYWSANTLTESIRLYSFNVSSGTTTLWAGTFYRTSLSATSGSCKVAEIYIPNTITTAYAYSSNVLFEFYSDGWISFGSEGMNVSFN